MNRSESKYFNTAACMDEALLALLEKKDFAYITVKEVCQKAGVNRSTFYLHYESMADLLAESIEYLKKQFLTYFAPNSVNILQRIHDCPLDELFLITPEYLAPYLRYIQEHRAAISNGRRKRRYPAAGRFLPAYVSACVRAHPAALPRTGAGSLVSDDLLSPWPDGHHHAMAKTGLPGFSGACDGGDPAVHHPARCQ